MSLAERVQVARRYQRAIRLETDFGDPSALEGFICPQSSNDLLDVMARHVLKTGQGAFTWTGPYGGGKSSLAVVLGALLSRNPAAREKAATLLGTSTSSLLLRALPPGDRGWRVLAVTGRRDRPAQVIGEALVSQGFMKRRRVPKTWSEKYLLETLAALAQSGRRSDGGLVIFVDELGKFLESAARDGTDVHLFQDLAELASRSHRKMLLVGILHQAFEEYAGHLSHDMRDEWAKIQGRFVDLPVNADGNEQIDLLSRAIESDGRGKTGPLAQQTASLIQGSSSPHLAGILSNCWPLHPVTACLLGPLSRRRFGQNQRSLFGFLNSAEPHGFRDFLNRGSDDDLYNPNLLWDYLHVNLEPSILASSDGHRWALAVDALGRCEAASGSTPLHIRLLKVIALCDLLKERSRLPAGQALLELALPDCSSSDIRSALDQLRDWSLVAYRKFSNSWAVFEGSDFDIDHAVEEALDNIGGDVIGTLDEFTTLQPMMAKRHYHKTGAMRWFDVGVASLADISQSVATFRPSHGSVGRFLLALPTQGESKAKAATLCREAVRSDTDTTTVIGLSTGAWSIPGLARELAALEHVRHNNPELLGDRVARSEVLARIAAVRERIDIELDRAFEGASWYRYNSGRALGLSRVALNELASSLADSHFHETPRLHNELLGRVKPSGNAVAACKALMRRMVLHEQEADLGIEGYPAEKGLYASLLKETGLHREKTNVWRFIAPRGSGDAWNLGPLWKAARALLRKNVHRTVALSEVYDLWRDKPFGVKDGFLPVLSLVFLMSERSKLAFYRDGVF